MTAEGVEAQQDYVDGQYQRADTDPELVVVRPKPHAAVDVDREDDKKRQGEVEEVPGGGYAKSAERCFRRGSVSAPCPRRSWRAMPSATCSTRPGSSSRSGESRQVPKESETRG